VGGDLDPGAIYASMRNTTAQLTLADAAHVPFRGGAFAAVATNLPFGHKYALPERPVRWFTALLAELERVTPSGGPLVFLVPEGSGWRVALERHARPVQARVDIRLLGMDTSIWRL
jgi:tRNA G10  N-methylase Trm11